MASSAVMGRSDHQTTNSGRQEHDQQPIRRNSCRRKARVDCDSKKKKQPRRGMGVAKLERLRLQDVTETDQPSFPLQFTEVNASPYFGQMGSTPKPYPYPYPYPNQVGTEGGFRTPGSFHGLAVSNHRRLQNHHDSDFLGKNSTDVIGGSFVKCYALHCNACHKKKKINGTAVRAEMYNCRQEFGKKQNIKNQAPQPPLGNYGNKVEVVAVHRKESCSSWDGENGTVLTEYDFFPLAKSEEGELAMMRMMKKQVGFPENNSSMAASNSIDLSLKLSC